jgi:hypothetical protein
MFGAAIAMTVVVQHGSPFSRYASGSGVSSLGDLEDSGSDLARLMDYLAQEEEPSRFCLVLRPFIVFFLHSCSACAYQPCNVQYFPFLVILRHEQRAGNSSI